MGLEPDKKSGIIDFGGGFSAKFLRHLRVITQNIGVGLLVLLVVIGFNCCQKPCCCVWAGSRSGLIVGYICALFPGMVDFSQMSKAAIFIHDPVPFKYGFV